MKIIYRSKLGCLIYPYKKKQSYAIEKGTALFDKVYHKWEEYVGFVLPYDGNNAFMTYNRDYSDLAKMLPNYSIEKMPLINSRRMSTSLHLRNIENFREAQTEIIGKIEETKSNENIWFINLQTGQGKTVLATYLSTELNLKTWIMCFSDEILSQWYDTYCDKTDIDPNRIIRITGSICDKILAGEINPDDYDVFMCTPTLLDRFGNKRSNYKRIADLFNMCGIGFLIYDEAHRNVSNIVKLNAIMDIRYQVYLSADFGQGDYEKEMIYRQIFRNVPVLTPSKSLQVTMKYTKLVVVNYNTYPDVIEQQEPFNKYGYNPELYMKYQFKKGTILGAIKYTLNTILNADTNHRILILFTNIEHVDNVYQILQEYYPGLSIGRFHGSASAEEKEFAKHRAKIIVATYSSFSTGLDADNIKYVLSTNQCNKVMDNQSAGRARPLADGSDAMYFMFVDNGFSYCKRKLKIRLEYLTKTKAKNDNPFIFNYHQDINGEG